MTRPLSAALILLALAALPEAQKADLAPFVPTPADVVDRMLKLAGVGPADTVYDLGSGDGRIVIAAAQKFGARGVGIEINPDLVAAAEAAARAAAVSDRVRFILQDVATADLSDATVVTLYLLAASNVKLRPMLTKQLRRGARIVAHDFPIGDWDPDTVDNFTDIAGRKRTLFLWNFDGVYRP
jgi:SAM-dependent methyltransferase